MKILKPNSNGLTLFEVLIVLAIIGVVAAISLPNLSSWTKSRSVQRDLAQLEALIDYAKVVSVNKSRRLFLRQTGANTIQLWQLKTGTAQLDAWNNSVTNCSWGSSNVEIVPEFSSVINFESALRSKHTINGQPGTAGNYNNTTSLMCFFHDGSTSSGGFHLTSDSQGGCKEYRIDVWLTGFYDKQINTKQECGAADNWIERN